MFCAVIFVNWLFTVRRNSSITSYCQSGSALESLKFVKLYGEIPFVKNDFNCCMSSLISEGF